MTDFDHIKSLLAPQCPQLTAKELDDLTCDVFVAMVWPEIVPTHWERATEVVMQSL